MTFITKLTASGFKSFAKKTDIPFGNNFNCILGPNGSGKSNVMDALCFVLGKSSAKSLRAEKSANLIYNGGKKDKPSKQAEVSIFFDNNKKRFPFEEKEIKLSRRVNKNGVSEYRINEKKVNRQEVVDLLSTASIDPDGHNVILQGDIVHFMEMKPVDRRLLIEDIAGISIYDERKGKALNDLGKVEEKLTEANIILTEREAHLRELKKDRDQAQKYKELQSKIKDNKATFLTLQIKDKKIRVEEVEKRLEKNNEKLTNVQGKIDEFRTKIDTDQERISEINSTLDEKGANEQKILQLEISRLRSDIIKYEERINTLQNEELKTQDRIEQLKKNVDEENQSKIESLSSEKVKLENEFKKLNEEEKVLSKEVETFRNKYGLSSFGDFNLKLEDIDKKIEDISRDISKKQEEKQVLLRERDKAEFELENIEREIKKFNDLNKKSNLSKVKKDFDSATKELGKLINEDTALARNLNIYRDQHEENQQKISRLNANAITIREHNAGDIAIRKIKELKDNNIFGTVADLGNVKGKHALALEVAAGARMRSVVVKDDLTAAKCIKYLKENKLGIVTFVPLNKIRVPKEDADIKKFLDHGGVEGLALKLVEFDPRYKKAFQHVFGNTVVVDDLNTARKIGVGRTRMVTLQGDLVESSGAMVGGYRKRTTGLGFNQKEISSELGELEDAQKVLRKKIDDSSSKRKELESRIDEIRNRRSELEGELIKVQNSAGLSKNISSLEDDMESLKSRLREYDSEIKLIDNNDLNKKLEDLKKNKSKIKETAFDNKDLSSNLEKQETKLLDCKERRIQVQSDIKRIDNQINMYNEENGKIRTIISNHQKELEEFKEELDNIYSVMDKKQESLKEKEEAEKQFYGKFKNLASERNKLMEFLKTHESKIREFEDSANKVRDIINDISIRRAKVVSELEGLDAEFELVKDGKIRRGINLDQLKQEINQFESMAKNIGNVNMRALEIYDELKEEYDILVSKSDKLRGEKDDVLEMISEIEQRKTGEFMKTFERIHSKFKEIYSQIATKGEASLLLENQEVPLDGGLDIRVRIAGNKYLDIRSLSGGEKTMAALAFIFSIQEHKPASFYLLDEVDAALDKQNSEKLSKLINQYSDKAQYIVISHNDAIITEANQIYGVSMQDGISKITSLKI